MIRHPAQLKSNDLFVRDEEVLLVAIGAEIAESEPKSDAFGTPESLYLRCEEFPQELFAAVLLGRVGQRGTKIAHTVHYLLPPPVPFSAAQRACFEVCLIGENESLAD